MILYLLIDFLQGAISPLEFLQFLCFSLIAVVIAITVHEWSHALASYCQGDKTAKYDGRLSLNPFAHLNIFGFLVLLLFGFGWARPVNVRASNFKRPRLGCAITAAAGPLSNFILAFIVSPFLTITILQSITNPSNLFTNLSTLLEYIMMYNLSLGLFNLIPVPPLDGSRILGECLPLKYRIKYYNLERYGFFIALGIILILDRIQLFDLVIYNIAMAFMRLWIPLFA